jgi:hypothetical protein
MEKLLTWDQRQTLNQLQLLLRRRCLAESTGVAQQYGHLRVLIHALDDSIVGSYRLACALQVRDEADALLAGFRATLFMSRNCLEAPRPLEDVSDQPFI